MEEDETKIPMCPYCGSKKLTRIDWGFADWECETCRNNFKSPYYKKKREYYKGHGGAPPKSSFLSDLIDSGIKYFMIILLIVCIVGSIIFFAVRLYQIFILPFL